MCSANPSRCHHPLLFSVQSITLSGSCIVTNLFADTCITCITLCIFKRTPADDDNSACPILDTHLCKPHILLTKKNACITRVRTCVHFCYSTTKVKVIRRPVQTLCSQQLRNGPRTCAHHRSKHYCFLNTTQPTH
jgi:hypothetical protein